MNNLSHAQTERLAKLMEELGEALQTIGKILIHGYESHHPKHPEVNNRSDLQRELGDVCAAIQLITEKGDLSAETILYYAEQKYPCITKYMNHQS